ncbi:MAG: elongation factor P [Clostridia bacterium]
MISTNDFRPGLTVEIDGQLLQIMESQHVKPGKGPAFVRAKFKNLMSGAITQDTMRAGEKVPRAHLEKRTMQYLYRDGEGYHFMDVQTYEQERLSDEDIGAAVNYLKENENVEVLTFKGRLVGVSLPASVELEVVDTVPGVRGDTVSGGGSKPATLETGVEVQVPLFVERGDVVRIDTRSGEYLERA